MKFIKNAVVSIALIICTIIFLINIIYISNVYNGWEETATISYYGIGNIIISFLIAIGIISISNYIEHKISKKNVSEEKIEIKKVIIFSVIFLIYIMIQIVWIIMRKSYPIADSMRVYEAACQIYSKETIYASRYFELYPQNLSLAYILSKIFMFVNSCSLIVIKVINVISNCFTVIGLYCILNLLQERYKINKTLFFMMSLTYVPLMLLVNFTYGDLISLPFAIFSLFFAMKYTKTEQKRYIAISAILMMISVMLRMNNLIYVIAITIYLILYLFEVKAIDDKKKYIGKIGIKILIIIMFVIVCIVPSKMLKNILEDRYALNRENAFPTVGFLAMGMQEGSRANGWYNSNADIGWNDDIEKAKEKYIEMINERVSYFSDNIFYTIKFYAKKVISIWAEPLQESIWQNLTFNFETSMIQEKTEEEINNYEALDEKIIENQNIIQLYQKALLFIIFGTIMAFIIKNKKNISNEVILLLVCFLGGFMFHILWEAKSRYIISYIVILIPLANIKLNSKMKENEEQ